jgi:hypothetical protein
MDCYGDKTLGFIKGNLHNKKGQGVVEYVMLLAVVTSIAASVVKSDAFQNVLGPDSNYFAALREFTTFNYRHCLSGTTDNSNYSGSHASYNGRFFTPSKPYN